jgi:hypothetical protein
MFRFGALSLTPTLTISQLGLDTNVLNKSADARRDFTALVTPGARAWIRIGRAFLATHTTADLAHFARTPGQSFVSLGETFRLDVPLARWTPRLRGEYSTTRQRLNSEIDQRVRRKNSGLGVGARFDLAPLVSLDADVTRTAYAFDDALIDGVRLSTELDRDITTVSAALRFDVTPLTTFIVRTDRERSSFQHSVDRDTTGWGIMPGFEFKPLALLAGSAFVGYRHLRPVDPAVPTFSGLAAEVKLRYLLRELTRVALSVDRHVEVSYFEDEPYFVSTGFEASVQQAIAGDWDLSGRIGRERMAYTRRGAAAAVDIVGRRVDHVNAYTIGLGYWFKFNARLGVDLVYGGRVSDVPGRTYRGFRVGGSFGYGF